MIDHAAQPMRTVRLKTRGRIRIDALFLVQAESVARPGSGLRHESRPISLCFVLGGVTLAVEHQSHAASPRRPDAEMDTTFGLHLGPDRHGPKQPPGRSTSESHLRATSPLPNSYVLNGAAASWFPSRQCNV